MYENRACGGVPNGSTGLVLDEDNSQDKAPRWLVRWTPPADVLGTGMKMTESLTYGSGVVSIDELSDEQLEDVVGGMDLERFSAWRTNMLNKRILK